MAHFRPFRYALRSATRSAVPVARTATAGAFRLPAIASGTRLFGEDAGPTKPSAGASRSFATSVTTYSGDALCVPRLPIPHPGRSSARSGRKRFGIQAFTTILLAQFRLQRRDHIVACAPSPGKRSSLYWTFASWSTTFHLSCVSWAARHVRRAIGQMLVLPGCAFRFMRCMPTGLLAIRLFPHPVTIAFNAQGAAMRLRTWLLERSAQRPALTWAALASPRFRGDTRSK